MSCEEFAHDVQYKPLSDLTNIRLLNPVKDLDARIRFELVEYTTLSRNDPDMSHCLTSRTSWRQPQ